MSDDVRVQLIDENGQTLVDAPAEAQVRLGGRGIVIMHAPLTVLTGETVRYLGLPALLEDAE